MTEHGKNPGWARYGGWQPTPEELARLPEELRRPFDGARPETPSTTPETKRERGVGESRAETEAPPTLAAFVAEEASRLLEEARTTEASLLKNQEEIQRQAIGWTTVPRPGESLAEAISRAAESIEQSQNALRDHILSDRQRAESLIRGIAALERGESTANFSATLDSIEAQAAEALRLANKDYQRNPNAVVLKEVWERAQKRLQTIADLRQRAGR